MLCRGLLACVLLTNHHQDAIIAYFLSLHLKHGMLSGAAAASFILPDRSALDTESFQRATTEAEADNSSSPPSSPDKEEKDPTEEVCVPDAPWGWDHMAAGSRTLLHGGDQVGAALQRQRRWLFLHIMLIASSRHVCPGHK